MTLWCKIAGHNYIQEYNQEYDKNYVTYNQKRSYYCRRCGHVDKEFLRNYK